MIFSVSAALGCLGWMFKPRPHVLQPRWLSFQYNTGLSILNLVSSLLVRRKNSSLSRSFYCDQCLYFWEPFLLLLCSFMLSSLSKSYPVAVKSVKVQDSIHYNMTPNIKHWRSLIFISKFCNYVGFYVWIIIALFFNCDF